MPSDRGQQQVTPRSSIELLGEHRAHNLFRVDGRYCAIPQALGPFTLKDEHVLSGPYALWTDRLEDLRALVDEKGAFGDFDPLYSPTPLTSMGPPEVVEIELIHTCNLRCVMCHVSFEEMSKTRLDPSFVGRLRGLRGKWAKLGAMYEPVAHPEFARIARELTALGLKIDLTTNGTLFTPELISEIRDCDFRVVTISFDGARRETYERVRRRADYHKALERILAFKTAVQAVNPNVLFQINYTILQSNIDEIVEAVDLWETHGFDHIGFISMVLPVSTGDIVRESPEPVLDRLHEQMSAAARRVIERKYRITLSSPWFFRDTVRSDASGASSPGVGVVIADHPNAADPNEVKAHRTGLVVSDHPSKRLPISPSTHFQNGGFPGMHVSCRSPFKFVRINYDGAVRLCQKFTVGSIYEDDLLAIWEGAGAEALRADVRKDAEVCHRCEYFKFCIRAGQVDYDDDSVFLSNDRIEIVAEGVRVRNKKYNVLRYAGKFYRCPTPLEISPQDLLSRERRKELGIEESESFRADYDDTKAFPSYDRIEIVEERILRYNVLRFNGKFYMCPTPLEVSPQDLLGRERREELGIEEAISREDAVRRGEASLRLEIVDSAAPDYDVLRYGRMFYMCPKGTRAAPEDLVDGARRRDLGVEVADSLEAAHRAGQAGLIGRITKKIGQAVRGVS